MEKIDEAMQKPPVLGSLYKSQKSAVLADTGQGSGTDAILDTANFGVDLFTTVFTAGSTNVVKGAKGLPLLDSTGKVHGTLPKVTDFANYSKDELRMFLGDLVKSVQKRIEVTSIKGRDRGHGQRQGAEQDLIKSLKKYLEDDLDD